MARAGPGNQDNRPNFKDNPERLIARQRGPAPATQTAPRNHRNSPEKKLTYINILLTRINANTGKHHRKKLAQERNRCYLYHVKQTKRRKPRRGKRATTKQNTMTTREQETRNHRTANGTRPRHANMRRFLNQQTRKAKQAAARLWEEETARTAASTAAAILTLIFWNLAALHFFNAL